MPSFGKRHKRLKPSVNQGHGFSPWPFCFSRHDVGGSDGFATSREENEDCATASPSSCPSWWGREA